MMTLQTAAHLPKHVQEMANSVKEMMLQLISRGQEMKRKASLKKQFLERDITELQVVSDSLSSLDDQKTAEEIEKQQQQLLTLDKKIDEATNEICRLQIRVKEAENQLTDAREELNNINRAHPRARYSVNLYREVSKISWHIGPAPSEVKGFIRGKSSVKTFCFDELKQSRYFISNSLWEMGRKRTFGDLY